MNIIAELKTRFQQFPDRHKDISWDEVEARLLANPAKCEIVAKMEATGGEPDIVGIDKVTGEILIFDCAEQSPINRRSFCYDDAALQSRKTAKPANSAQMAAREIGAEILDEAQYQFLQTLGEFDTKTSSWIKTPAETRALGGSIFGDRRFGRVFIYHNGAESYYAARGFRCVVRI